MSSYFHWSDYGCLWLSMAVVKSQLLKNSMKNATKYHVGKVMSTTDRFTSFVPDSGHCFSKLPS